jgi:poly-gamma-glutamate capsule biosynthesis protein CapA/YwtB (metallophosphatase superfamily)
MSESVAQEGQARIAFVGDVFVERDDASQALRRAAPYLRDHFDLRMANLEAPLSTRGTLKRSFPWASLRAHPRNVAALTTGFFDVVSLANNHAMDYGPEGLTDTMALLDRNGIRYVGAGVNWAEAWTPITLTAGDVRIRIVAVEATSWSWIEHDAGPERPGMAIVFVSPFFPDHVDGYRLRYLLDTVERARGGADGLVVSIHWGVSVSHQICTYQQYVGHLLVECGADVVVGHHPHTLQAVEVYRDRPIFYSLGNFVFDSLTLPPEGAVVGCVFTRRGLERVTLRPTRQVDGEVRVLSAGDVAARPIVELLSSLSTDVGTRLAVDGDDVVVTRS